MRSRSGTEEGMAKRRSFPLSLGQKFSMEVEGCAGSVHTGRSEDNFTNAICLVEIYTQ